MRSYRNLEGRTFYRSGRRSGPASLQIDLKELAFICEIRG